MQQYVTGSMELASDHSKGVRLQAVRALGILADDAAPAYEALGRRLRPRRRRRAGAPMSAARSIDPIREHLEEAPTSAVRIVAMDEPGEDAPTVRPGLYIVPGSGGRRLWVQVTPP